MSLTEREIVKLLTAKAGIEHRSVASVETFQYVIRTLAPAILKLIREEVAEERRRGAAAESQR